ncbi:NAD(P)-binding protein [Aeromicrobium sp. SMF47]|uniref:NAD(P)-binding protein n=1 Tax=Aeromicrobium yanjiei TaxID=2662028 RepID=A0A5Q2MF27_9ACTN|nr:MULTISPECIES: NAD(P)/FAD-dependent oxidoreductase [Aeromicrobium]MRJ77127.1 NAD(P)-binding protein [Aeromicrobium yanjiei]MRK01494.1 NAD(P)-binding protein [Aeromicrobium sp. S22]QGG41734.1 NAD(P)-binding protein [Aeromicrobium yanjiei]
MTSIGIIGSGFGAIAVAVELKRSGHTDLRLWERSDDLGGVWRDNTYPGAGCDVPSPLYSYSYEPNSQWTRRYALQEEIHAYIRSVADKHGITPLVRFGAEVVAAAWDEDAARWSVTFSDGTVETVDLLVSAVGQLSRPRLPSIEGVQSFTGTSFHSAEWDHSFDATGKRVAVVGAGASAVQFVPHLAKDAAQLVMFQRTPNYLLPKPDKPYTAWHRALFKALPISQRIERGGIWTIMEQFARGLDEKSKVGRINKAIAMRHLNKQVTDPELRAKLTPDYPIGCKRILFSNEFYPALAQPNVDVVTHGVTRVTPTGVVDDTGAEHEVDAIVYGTGFDAQDFLESIDITGVGGQKLATHWTDGAHAYLGMYVPGFPNLLVTYGPNTNLGGGSIIYMLEAQARHMRQVVDRLEAGSYRSVVVTEKAERDYDRELTRQLDSSVWSSCDNWYRHPSGRITSNWPGATLPFAKATKHLEPEAFEWA